MISAGKAVTTANDRLAKIPIAYLYNNIRNPKNELAELVKQLAIIKAIDKSKYTLLKKELPYVVCAVFNPPFRKTEHFAYTEYFILDIDHIGDKGLDLTQVRKEIEADENVLLCFVSPSRDGLKVMFKLKERCTDAGLYSLFYKAFAKRFATEHHITQVIDPRTSDVCRACFVSIDECVYYNEAAMSIDIKAYIDIENPYQMFELKVELEKELKSRAPDSASVAKESSGPGEEALLKIKEILKVKAKKTIGKQIYVPDRLNEVIEDLTRYITDTGIVVKEIININYGKKIRMRLSNKEAEVNVFYGKKGFSIVQSPRTGTNAELNEIAAELIDTYFML